MERRYINAFRIIAVISSMILIILILIAWINEGWKNEWKAIQSEYAELIEDPVLIQTDIQQVVLEDFNRTDRCITCHQGIENTGMEEVPQPHRVHPGNHLEFHPVQKYGCTICHGGQGRAISRLQAFGQEPEMHWDSPLLREPFIQSSCGKCHTALFTERKALAGTEIFIDGLGIFNREGCLGCHKARGVGGTMGPDLTQQGEKTKHEYSFQNIRGEQSISNWLKEHFKDPEVVSPGSQMLAVDLQEEELDALVTFVMGLAMPEFSFSYLSVDALNEFKGVRADIAGRQSYDFFCSACHGKNGEGKDFKEFKYGIPAIGDRDFLSIASEDYLRFTLLRGRGKRLMASWTGAYSGLFDEELESLIKSLQEAGNIKLTNIEDIPKGGSVNRGSSLFNENCLMCHGEDGAGALALAINKTGFLELASPRFILGNLLEGRKNTAMPSWSSLGEQGIADIMALIDSWRTKAYRPAAVQITDGDKRKGELQFHYLCSRCHGEFGEGNTGPAVLNKSFLKVAEGEYLFRTIAEGRANTAMFGWATPLTGQQQLGRQEISDIISFMKSSAERRWDYIYPGSNPGDKAIGEEIFLANCTECHGQEGEGIQAPAINNQELLNAATNGYLMASVSLGRTGTRMPSWGRGTPEYTVLTSKQRQDVVAWIRSWQRINIKYE